MRSKKLLTMAECAIMISLAFALSWVTLWKMPMGGSVTLASMLPIMLIGIKYGPKIGVGTAFLYSLTQLIQAISQGDVFVYCQSASVSQSAGAPMPRRTNGVAVLSRARQRSFHLDSGRMMPMQ